MVFQFQTIKSFKTKTIFTELTSGDSVSTDDDKTNSNFSTAKRFAKPFFQLDNNQNVQGDINGKARATTENQFDRRIFVPKIFKTIETLSMNNDANSQMNKINSGTASMKQHKMVNFSDLIQRNPPYVPPYLLTNLSLTGRNNNKNKSKVMMKICNIKSSYSNESSLAIDQQKKVLTVKSDYCNDSPYKSFPKQYSFDTIFNENDFHSEICNSIIKSNDLLHSVLGGTNACIFTYGQLKSEKTKTMFGTDRSSQTMGVAPLCVYYLFKLIEKTKKKISVGISALEISGYDETCYDLLSQSQVNHVNNKLIESTSQFSCDTLCKAFFYLDKALNNRSKNDISHVVVTLFITQNNHDNCYSPIQSKLSLIDFGHLLNTSTIFNKENAFTNQYNTLTTQQLGHIINCVLNDQKLLPFRDSILTTLVSETMGSLVSMVSHINENQMKSKDNDNEMLQVIQLSSKIMTSNQNIDKKIINNVDTNAKIVSQLGTLDLDKMTIQTKQSPAIPIRKFPTKKQSDLDEFSSVSEIPSDTVIHVNQNNKRQFKRNSNILNSTFLSDSEKINPTFRVGQIKLGLSHKNRSPSSYVDNEIWIDGPKSKIQTPRKILTPSNGLNLNEIWIDGPRAQLDSTGINQITDYFDMIKECYDKSDEDSRGIKMKSKSTDSLECLDRKLLRQLNEHDATIESVFKNDVDNNVNIDSRPISLLSFHSTCDSVSIKSMTSDSKTSKNENDLSEDDGQSLTDNEVRSDLLSYEEKLENLKQSSNEMIFKKSSKEMESLHKTLESFLNMETMMKMKPINRTVLTTANDLTKLACPVSQNQRIEPVQNINYKTIKNIQGHRSKNTQLNCDVEEKDTPMSWLVSPIRFRPISQIQASIQHLEEQQNYNNERNELFERPTYMPQDQINKPKHLSFSSIGSSMFSPSSSSSNSSSSQSPNNSCSNHYELPLFHSSPINQNLESTNKLSDTYSEPFDDLNKLFSPTGSEKNYGYSNNKVIIKNVSKRVPQVNRASSPVNSTKNKQQHCASNRLFYNFNNNKNNFVLSMPNTPAHVRPKNIVEINSIKPNPIYRESSPSTKRFSRKGIHTGFNSVPCSPLVYRKQATVTEKKQSENSGHNFQGQSQQPVLKLLKQTATLLTGSVTGTCGGMLGSNNENSTSNTSIEYNAETPKVEHVKKTSILNRIFRRSASKDTPKSNEFERACNRNSNIHIPTFKIHDNQIPNKKNTCFSISSSSSTSSTSSNEIYTANQKIHQLNQIKKTPCELSSSGYDSFVNESQNDDSSEYTTSCTNSKFTSLQRVKTDKAH